MPKPGGQGVITVVVGDPQGTLEAHQADSLRMNLGKPEDQSIGFKLDHRSSAGHRQLDGVEGRPCLMATQARWSPNGPQRVAFRKMSNV